LERNIILTQTILNPAHRVRTLLDKKAHNVIILDPVPPISEIELFP
jgi:hypothetical protein